MKPLNRKNYGSIGHLPSSRMGPSDHHVHEGQQRICTVKARDKHDLIIVTEKVDGSNVGIARVGDTIHALGRAGYLAQSSKYEQHQLFAYWVRQDEQKWLKMLQPGERLVGEWLAQAHGSRYSLPHGPFVPFDLMVDEKRFDYDSFLERLNLVDDLVPPKLLHVGGPISVEEAMKWHAEGNHGLFGDEPEGIVYRVERKGEFDFMAKWVRPDKIDGKYLPEITGKEPIWNWKPNKEGKDAA
jgi:hypothetical protein